MKTTIVQVLFISATFGVLGAILDAPIWAGIFATFATLTILLEVKHGRKP